MDQEFFMATVDDSAELEQIGGGKCRSVEVRWGPFGIFRAKIKVCT